MNTLTLVLLIILAVMIVIFIVLYILGKKIEKKQIEQNEIVERTSQSCTMLIIDKKKMKLSKSGLPPEVIANTPFYARFTKVPVIKAKVGPKIMTLVCDPSIYPSIPVKREVKASVSGMYISAVRGLHGKIEAPTERPGFFKRLFNRD